MTVVLLDVDPVKLAERTRALFEEACSAMNEGRGLDAAAKLEEMAAILRKYDAQLTAAFAGRATA